MPQWGLLLDGLLKRVGEELSVDVESVFGHLICEGVSSRLIGYLILILIFSELVELVA